jgi:predicted transcriptional regulator
MLVKMERKGVVRHRSEGRRFVYSPTVSEAKVQRTMVGELTERLFGGDVTALVSHLLSEHDTNADELEELKRLIAEREAQEV